MTGRIIHSTDCIAEGCDWLARAEPRFGEVIALAGPPPLRRREGGFPALLKAICSQQLSVAAADSVSRKLTALGAEDPRVLIALDDEDLRGCGLSRPKIRYARALAEADLDYDALAVMPEEDAIATLTAIKGIGVWTAEIYLMFAIGRADVFAPGDLALQEATRLLFDLPARPQEKALRVQAESWSPWRAVAARLLWHYYRHAKSREGISE
ncbi:DNA-3-methyladenine glycosylase 2 family protein [Limibaculum sp. M0105]|uniref:DNA-3-methyladenine glycosylase II n=1 Tax=Thermohalobaculum xanthum TaxID=2753746 RepID=A0A8J7M4V6_9RHOB|nr:DNA-3-methyladenine glycosylase [Thermohalobaculum xanthum]MBK0398354.1 DNA-3-methyladenine glycosylase 2 family protein [Thermohalobaculum xanthum]